MCRACGQKTHCYTGCMADDDQSSDETVTARVRALVAAGTFRVTQHAQQEMFAEAITLDEVVVAIATGDLLEDYSDHRRGACCLLGGRPTTGRPLHVVCTTGEVWSSSRCMSRYRRNGSHPHSGDKHELHRHRLFRDL